MRLIIEFHVVSVVQWEGASKGIGVIPYCSKNSCEIVQF